MNSLERAKALVARTGKQLALTILPLAAATVSAQASSISLPSSTYLCGTSDSSAAEAVGNGVQFSFPATSCSGGGVYLDATGGATGMSTGNTFPVSWNFGVASGGADDEWTIQVFMPDSAGNQVFEATGSLVSGSGEVTGSSTATVASSGGAGYYVVFNVSGGTVTLNSLDLNVSPVPEPASLFLVVPGLGLCLLKRRKSAPRT